MIIAIDGPAGAGKSTVAKQLAQRLGFRFLDTGAMYRGVGLAMLESQVDLADEHRVVELASDIHLYVDGEVTKVNNRDVSHLIRTAVVSDAASRVAAIPGVRELLVQWQREIGRSGDYVCEGRDQGSVVFPDAEFKFFITASLEGRAERRWKEIVRDCPETTLEEVIADLTERDQRDSNRTVGALTKADDAIEINTDKMTIEQVIESLLSIVVQRSNTTALSPDETSAS